MGLVLLGMAIAIGVVGVIILVYWVKYHHEVIDLMKEKLENVEDSLESAHRYFDQRIEQMHADLREENYKIHRRLEENSKEIHDRIGGEVKILEGRITDEIGSVQIETGIKENEYRRELNNVFSEINNTK